MHSPDSHQRFIILSIIGNIPSSVSACLVSDGWELGVKNAVVFGHACGVASAGVERADTERDVICLATAIEHLQHA
jgi:hypothetical protein